MRLHQNLTFLAFTFCFVVAAGFSYQASAQSRPIVVGTFTGKTADPRGQTCFYVEDESAGQVIAKNGTVLNVSAEQQHFLLPGDVRCPKAVPLWHGRSGAWGWILLGLHDRQWGQDKHHLCSYYLDDTQLAYWSSKHPNAPRPLFEAVVPVSTQCPSPSDDYTPFDLMTPAEHLKYEGPVLTDCKAKKLDALTKLAPAGRAVSRSSLEYASIESTFESCLTAGGAAARGVMLQALKELPELTGSRRLAPGVEELSLGTAQGQDCWQVQINGGNPIDQYLCIDPSKGVIYVGTQYTTPPQMVPLSQWRATHTGFTFQGKPVLLPVEPLDPSAKAPTVEDSRQVSAAGPNRSFEPIADRAGILTDSQMAAINSKSLSITRQSGLILGVMLVTTTGAEPFDVYCRRVLDTFSTGESVGSPHRVIVLATQDRKLGIQLEPRLQQHVSNAGTSQILALMLSSLKQADTAGALNVALDEIARRSASPREALTSTFLGEHLWVARTSQLTSSVG